jgi:nucleoside-diphosphate-sugar epimerase
MNLQVEGSFLVKGSSAYSGKRVLLTGADGFIGKHLSAGLREQGARVGHVVRKSASPENSVESFIGDICDQDFLPGVIDSWQPQIIFHLAASKVRAQTPDAFRETLNVNLMGTLGLLMASSRSKSLTNIVLLGTGEEYGKNLTPFKEGSREAPVSAYSLSKLSATHLAQMMARSGLPVCVLRPSVAYGPGQQDDMFIPALIRTLLRGEKFPMTKGAQTRDFLFIADLVQALLLAGVATNVAGEVINIGSGDEVCIAKLVDSIEELTGAHGHALRGLLDYRQGEAMHYQLDISKARHMLGWKPEIALEEGLARTVQWYRERQV